jgi:plastocyanin
MRQRIHLCLLVVFVLASLPAHAGEAMVHVGHNKLDPSDLKVAAGTTVVFHNMDEMPGGHSIVADDGSFQSPALAKDQSWSHTFTKPGVHGYSIKEHPSAKGTIVVE